MLLPDEAATIQYIRGGIQLNTDRMLVMGNYVLPRLNVSKENCKFKSLLYAPTFEGHSEGANFSSIAEITDHLIDWTKINGGFLFKPHDGTGVRIHDLKKMVELLHRLSSRLNISDKSEIFNESDFIVSDVSGIISEYIYTNKPIIVPISKKVAWKYNYIKSSSIAKYCYFWNCDEMTLPNFIKSIENDPLRLARENRREELYPQIMSQEDSIKLFDKAITYVHSTFEFRLQAHPKIFHI
jgi:CDP-glycerol glycerophosphotransferase (TagB/SpsB family)